MVSHQEGNYSGGIVGLKIEKSHINIGTEMLCFWVIVTKRFGYDFFFQ